MAITCALSPQQIEKLYTHVYKIISVAKNEGGVFDYESFIGELFSKISKKKDADTAAKFIQQVPLLLLTASVKPQMRGLKIDLTALQNLDLEFTNPEKGIDSILKRYDSTIQNLKDAAANSKLTSNKVIVKQTDVLSEQKFLPQLANSSSYFQLAPFTKKELESDDPLLLRTEDPNRAASYAILDLLKEEATSNNDGSLTFRGTDIYLKAMLLSEIPKDSWDLTTLKTFELNDSLAKVGRAKRATSDKTPVVVLTDKSGNILKFSNEGEITDLQTGTVVFQFLRNIQYKNGKLVSLDPFGENEDLASVEEIAAILKVPVEIIKETRDAALKSVKELNDSVIKGGQHFLSIVGISEGVNPYLIGNYISLKKIAKQNPTEVVSMLSSLQSRNDGASDITINGEVYIMQRPYLYAGLIEEIASALTSSQITDAEKKKYYAQFFPVRISDTVSNHYLDIGSLTFYTSPLTYQESNSTLFNLRSKKINGVDSNLSQAYLKSLSPEQVNTIKNEIVRALSNASGTQKQGYKTSIFPIVNEVTKSGYFKFNTETQKIEPSNYFDLILEANPLINTFYGNKDRTYDSYFIFDSNIELSSAEAAIYNETVSADKSAIRKAKDDLYDYLDSKSLTIDVTVRFVNGTASNQNERLLVENPLTNEDLITVIQTQSEDFLNIEEGDLVTLKIVKSGMEGYNPEFPTAIGIYDNQKLLGFVAETDFKAKEEPRKPLSQQETKVINDAFKVADEQDNIDNTPEDSEDDNILNIFRSALLDGNVTESEIKAAESWWKNSPLSKFININTAIKIVNSDAYAKFVTYGAKLMSDGKFGEIQINPSGSFVDVYHEAWHGFSQLFLTKKQKRELYNEVRNSNSKYKDYTFLQLEELLAEDFRTYAKNQNVKPNSPKRNTIFRRIFNFLKNLFGLTKTGEGLTHDSYSLDILEIPSVKEYFEELYFADKNPDILSKYTPMIENVMFDELNRGISKVGRSSEDALSKADSTLISDSIDSIISKFVDDQAFRFGTKSATLAFFSETKTEKGIVPKDILYNHVYKVLESRLAEMRKDLGLEVKSPLSNAKTLKDVENASIGVIKSSKGNDKYIFLSSQLTDFANLELAIKKGNKAKGRSYFGIDIVTDFYRLKTVKNKNGKPVDIIIASDRSAAVSQYENYLRGGAQEFESIKFKDSSLVSTPVLTPKQERQLHNIKVLEKALENWGNKKSGTIKYHIENSTFDVTRQVYTEIVEFDADGNEIDSSEDNNVSPSDTYADNVGTKSLLQLADKETIYAIKSLFKVKNGKPVLNELGFPELVDFRSTWNVIARELVNTITREEMYEKLVSLSNQYPEIKQLIKYKLPAPGEISLKNGLKSKHVNYEFNISNSFYQTFSKPRIPILNNVLFVKYDNVTRKYYIESNLLQSVADNPVIIANFKSKFKRNSENPFGITTKTNAVILDVDKVVNTFKNIENKSGSEMLKFLRALGFELDDISDIKKDLKNNHSYYGIEYLYKVVEGVSMIDRMTNATKEQRELSLNFKTDPISVFQSEIKKGLLPNFKTSVKQNTQVNRIVKLHADKGINSAEFTAKNAAGNKMYEIMEHFTISKTLQSLNSLTNLNDAWDNTGTNTPKFTSYLDPEINSFTLRSQILKSIFNTDSPIQDYSKRYTDAKISLEYLGGSAVEGIEESYGVETTKLDPASYVMQQMHTMLKGGIMEFIRHASKSASFGVRVDGAPIFRHNLLKKANNLYVDIEMFKDKTALDYALDNILIPYIAVEFDRINKFNSDPSLKNIAGYNKKFYYRGKEQLNGQSFLAFDDVLSKKSLDWLYSKAKGTDLTIDIIAEINNPANQEIKNQITKEVKVYFNKIALQNKATIDSVGAIDSSLLEKAEDSTTLAAAFTLNAWIHNFEIIHLFYGDMAQYDYLKDDLFKRNTGSTSNGPGFLNDKYAHDFINNVFNKNQTYAYKLMNNALKSGDIALAETYSQNMFMYDGILRTAVVEETVRPKSIYFDDIKEGLEEDYREQFSNLKLSETELKKLIDSRVNEDMKAYTGIEEGDGAGYITFDAYRTLKKLENDWLDPQENLYQKIINGVEVKKEEVTLAFPAYKLQNYGALAGVKLPAFAMHKFALFPIIPSVYKNSELEKLHKIMLKKNIQYLTFASGSKIASISKDGSPDKIYADVDKKQILDDVDFTPNLIYVESLKKATNVAPKLKGKIKHPTQEKGILIDNLFNEGIIRKPEFQKPYDDYKNTVNEYSEILKIVLLDEIGFKYNVETGQYSGDLKKLLEVFQQELERRDVPQHLVEFLGIDLSGNLINDLSLHLEADTLEKIILAVIQKRLIDQNTKGEALVQMPNSMMNSLWDKQFVAEKDPEKIKALLGSNTLPFYNRTFKIINGKKVYGLTDPMKIAISLQGDFYNLLNLDYNGEKIETIDRLNQAIKDPKWLKNNKEAITISGSRIPIQKHNSLEFAQIWHFLDPAASNTVIVPTELVAKAGSDFDVDKIFWNFPNLTNEGSVIKEDTSLEEILKRINSKDKKDKKDLNALIQQKLKALQNQLITTKVNILSLPAMYASLVKPNATYIMKSIADELETVATDYNRFDVVHDSSRTYLDKNGKEKQFTSPTRSLEVGMNAYKFQVNLESKDSLGIVANQNKFSPIAKSIGAKLPEKFNITYWDVNAQAPVELPYVQLPYRVNFKTNKLGNSISLSGNYSQDGERIADIYDHMMNGLLDVEKDAWIFFLQTNAEMINTINTLIEMGIPKRDVIYFVSQPLIRDYVKKQKQLKSVYKTAITRTKLSDAEAKREALTEILKNKFDTKTVTAVNKAKLNHISSTINGIKNVLLTYFDSKGDAVTKSVSISTLKKIISEAPLNINNIKIDSETSIYKPATLETLFSSTNIYYLDEVINKNNLFEFDKLIISINNINAENQVNALVHLASLEQQLKTWQNFKRNSTPDTKRVKTTYQMNKKEQSYEDSLEASKLDKSTVQKLRKDSVLSSFNISDFALDVVEPLFNLRMNPTITRYIGEVLTQRRAIITKNGFPKGFEGEEKFTGAFNNAVVNYIFQNTLSNFTNSDGSITSFPDVYAKRKLVIKTGIKNHVEITTDTIFVDRDAILSDYQNGLYLRENTSANNYIERGLKTFFTRDDVFPTPTSFVKFVIERELLRSTNPIEKSKKNPIYLRIQELIKTKEVPDNVIYEAFIAHKALINTYNRAGLMTLNNLSYTDLLMDVIEKNIDSLSAFPIVSKLQTVENPSIIRRGLRVISLKNKPDVVGELAETYENNLRQLADPSIKKVEDPDLNLYISQMFYMLPLVATYQHGVGYSLAGFPKALPTGSYLNIMKRAEDLFLTKYLSESSLHQIFRRFTAKENDKYTFGYKNYVVEPESYTGLTSTSLLSDSTLPTDDISTQPTQAPVSQDNKPKGKQDIEEFKQFVDKESIKIPIDNLGLSGYKRGGQIISDSDITKFNVYLGKSNNVKPQTFFTTDTKFAVFYNNATGKREGAPQQSIWVLKDNGYYDLIDQMSGEVYINNVDLQTGYKFEEPLEGGFGTTKIC